MFISEESNIFSEIFMRNFSIREISYPNFEIFGKV